MVRLRADEDRPRLETADDVQAGRVAEIGEWVAAAVEDGVHVRDGVDAVAAGAVRGLADRVDALIADPARFHERLLHREPVRESRPDLVRAPERNAFPV